MREIQIVDDYDNTLFCYYEIDESIDIKNIQDAIRKYREEDITYDEVMDKVASKFGGSWYFPSNDKKNILYI